MKRFFVLFAGLFFLGGVVSAQNVSAVTVEFSKDAMRPAFSMQLDCSKKIAEEALKKRLKKDRIKGKSSGSMMLYKKGGIIGTENSRLMRTPDTAASMAVKINF